MLYIVQTRYIRDQVALQPLDFRNFLHRRGGGGEASADGVSDQVTLLAPPSPSVSTGIMYSYEVFITASSANPLGKVAFGNKKTTISCIGVHVWFPLAVFFFLRMFMGGQR